MGILRERTTWHRPQAERAPSRRAQLTESEVANARKAIEFLRVRYGGWEPLAKAMGVHVPTLRMTGKKIGAKKRPLTAAHALYAARLAGVPVEDVLRGAWPPPDACPRCGRYS